MTLLLEGVRLPLAHFELDASAEATGQVIGIFGPSGAGKTSLLDTIAGLRVLREGRIRVGEVVLDDCASGLHVPARDRHIGYVPQENVLFPHMTVLQNVRYGAGNAPIDRVVDILEIGHLLDRGVTALSGGEQKRVALARALVTSPRLLLLDEPLAGLDRRLHQRIAAFLRRVRDDLCVPMLYVTHDPSELLAITDETLVLEQGRIVAAGKTRAVLNGLDIQSSKVSRSSTSNPTAPPLIA
jgi:molybdate transport system ATP-binding protein